MDIKGQYREVMKENVFFVCFFLKQREEKMFLYNLLTTLSVDDALVQTGGLYTKICHLKGTKSTESIMTTPQYNTILMEYLQDEDIFNKLKHIEGQPYKNGSIGSVYVGELHSGTVVCLKVLHNDIQTKLESQIKLLKSSSSLLKFIGFDVGMVGEELESMFLSETNMLLEMKNQENFIHMWHDVDWIHIPAVIPKMCTQSVLCTEFLESVPLKEYLGDKKSIGFSVSDFCLSFSSSLSFFLYRYPLGKFFSIHE